MAKLTSGHISTLPIPVGPQPCQMGLLATVAGISTATIGVSVHHSWCTGICVRISGKVLDCGWAIGYTAPRSKFTPGRHQNKRKPGTMEGQWSPHTAGFTSSTMPMTFTWDLDYSHGQGNPIGKIYEMTGDYLVTMTVTNACGHETVSQIVTVASCVPPHDASFTWFPAEPYAGYPVTFTGSASGTMPIDFAWSFSDGGTGMGRTVAHIFEMPGDYDVTMAAMNACGMETVTHVVHVAGGTARMPRHQAPTSARPAVGRLPSYWLGPAGLFYLPVLTRW